MYDESRLFLLSKPVGIFKTKHDRADLKKYTLDTINDTGLALNKDKFISYMHYKKYG